MTTAAASRNGRTRRGLSMGTWLAIALLTVTIASLLVSSLVTLTQATQLADDLFAARSSNLLSLQREEIERYMRSMQRNAAVLAANGTVLDAARRFPAAYTRLDDQLDRATVADATDELGAYYDETLVEGLEAVTGQEVTVADLLPTLDAARVLQARYTVPDTDAVDLDDDRAGSWSAVHTELHPALAKLADRAGFADLMLVEPDDDTVVYTVAKLSELGTSLDVGPYSGSVLAAGVRAVAETAGAAAARLTDIAPYGPQAGVPAGFVVAPVTDGDRLLAVLVGKLNSAEIDRIMTAGGRWDAAGFGTTGETYLIGSDGRMRSVARTFVEDPDEYLSTVARSGTATAGERRAIAATGTTAVFQRVFTDSELDALPESSLPVETAGYLGRDDVAAVQPIDLADVDWTVVTQASRAELEAPLAAYRRVTLVVVALAAVAIALLAVAWARRLFRPLRAISGRLQRLHDGRATRPVAVADRAPREFAELADSVEHMVTSLERQRADVDAAAAKRRETLRSLLPPTVAERIDQGDRRVVDQIAQASVVVLTVGGLGELLQRGDLTTGREAVDRMVETLDALAERNGLVRVKLLGDSFFAGCGLERPYLDHALRAANFARAAQQEARGLHADAGGAVRLSVGIDSGPVTVGLTGSFQLVFEMWGDTVHAAHRLAQLAEPGETLVSARTRVLLPDSIAMSPRDDGDTDEWYLTDHVTSGEPAS